ncbi:endopeptidase [Rodentibacter pneumotropicus]|uniref:C40 family peptidase n=1 Tax=Rodentibacter pneumotropicus TaxID=758 RepID=A0AAW5L9C4_9PAST|nr:NlpC/P60 family protein [Rodentibacter pneumotropicus]MCQ9120442.1 C40 family peptidase [Rodentibacter pneumotropicus]OOF66906.1 endopeptidase [Rodentibacter pneumotropicus]
MLKRFLVITGVIILVTACSSGNNNTYRNKISESDDAQLTGLISKLEKGERGIHQTLRTNRPRSGLVSDKALAGVYNEWAGTRYRMGGSSKRGIDCSAFMQTTFFNAYGIKLPRSTAEQRYLGRKISKHELQKGDLVFFRGNHHVGVYIGNNQFMHASSSQGVTISSLDENYWARTYTQSRRIM